MAQKKRPVTTRPYDVSYKVSVIGESRCGKTSLLRRLADDAFTEHTISTIGIDCAEFYRVVEGVTVRLQIWDTAGQERYRTMTKAQFVGAKAIILVFDLTERCTFDQLAYWYKTLLEVK